MYLSQLFFLFSFTHFTYSDCLSPSVAFGNDSCLFPVGVNTFYEAQLDCLDMKGFLPSVVDDVHNEIIFNMTQERLTCSGVWIGLDDRGSWSDDQPFHYQNWAPRGDSNEGCAVLSSSDGLWSYQNCSERYAYFCVVPDPSTVDPPAVCNSSNVIPVSDYTVPTCTLNSICSEHWLVAAVVATNTFDHFEYALRLLDSMSSTCSSSDNSLLVTTNLGRTREDKNNCVINKLTKDYFYSTGTSTIYDVTVDGNVTSNSLLGLLEQAVSLVLKTKDHFQSMCIKSSSYTKRGIVLYVLTDVACSTLCSGDLPDEQKVLIKDFVERGFVVEFIHLDVNSICLRNVFSQCGVYSRAQCETQALDTTSSSERQGTVRVLRPCDSYVMPIGLIIALVIVSCVSTIGLIVICVMRYKMKKQGNWSNFWRGEAQRRATTMPNSQTDEWELSPGQLQVLEEKQLGSGAFAHVYEGILTGKRPVDSIYPSSNIVFDVSGKVAVKRVPPHADWHAKKEFLEEITFMKQLGVHSHVMGMIGCITTADFPLMVLELCELGDLLAFIRKRSQEFNKDENGELIDKDLISIAWQISDGLSFLKANDIIHRDMAARNVLLTASLTAKISDFGLCRQADSSVYLSRGGRLPIKWMAIESLKTNTFSQKTDVWSFGVLLWEMYSLGEAPFPSVQPAEVLDLLQNGERLPRPKTCPQNIYEIMLACWAENPDERADVENIRVNFAGLLEDCSIHYGYLSLSSRNQENEENGETFHERLI